MDRQSTNAGAGQLSDSTPGPSTSLTDVLHTNLVPLEHWQRAFGDGISGLPTGLSGCRAAFKDACKLMNLVPKEVRIEIDEDVEVSAAKGKFLARLRSLIRLQVQVQYQIDSLDADAAYLHPFLTALQPSTLCTLKLISLDGAKLDQLVVSMLAQIAQLEILECIGCRVSCEEGLTRLEANSQLHTVKSLAAVQSLRCLHVQRSGFSKALRSTTGLTQLESLDCNFDLHYYDAKDLSELSRLINLQHLRMPDGMYSDFEVALKRLTSLTSLSMWQLYADELQAITASGMPLRRLEVRCHVEYKDNWAPPDSLDTVVLPSVSSKFFKHVVTSWSRLQNVVLMREINLLPGHYEFELLAEFAPTLANRDIQLICNSAAEISPDRTYPLEEVNKLARSLHVLPRFAAVPCTIRLTNLGAITTDLIQALYSVFPAVKLWEIQGCILTGLNQSVLQLMKNLSSCSTKVEITTSRGVEGLQAAHEAISRLGLNGTEASTQI